jgi:hypothetical protein
VPVEIDEALPDAEVQMVIAQLIEASSNGAVQADQEPHDHAHLTAAGLYDDLVVAAR